VARCVGILIYTKVERHWRGGSVWSQTRPNVGIGTGRHRDPEISFQLTRCWLATLGPSSPAEMMYALYAGGGFLLPCEVICRVLRGCPGQLQLSCVARYKTPLTFLRLPVVMVCRPVLVANVVPNASPCNYNHASITIHQYQLLPLFGVTTSRTTCLWRTTLYE
jgi:hypothetical protein